MPKFNKKIPKNYKTFFSPSSDEEYKAKHPIGYWVLVFFGIFAFVMPPFVFIILNAVFEAPNSAWQMLGLVGAFIFGTGLFNIVAAWIKQYFGHLFTFICFTLGGLMVFISELLLFNEKLYNLFDEEMVSYYFATLLFISLPIIFYSLFRYSFTEWIKSKNRISKTKLKKLRKGKLNYWWYEELSKEYHLGVLYFINKIFTIVYPAAFILSIFVGWIRIMSIPIGALILLAYLLSAIMSIFSRIQDNIETHGTPIVLLAKSSNGGIDSILFDLFYIAFILLAGYVHLMLTADLWGITIPHI